MTTPPNQERQARTIAKVVTRSAFCHIQDALDIGKLALWVGRYQKGQGSSAQTTGYIGVDLARVVFGDILHVGDCLQSSTLAKSGKPLEDRVKTDAVWLVL